MTTIQAKRSPSANAFVPVIVFMAVPFLLSAVFFVIGAIIGFENLMTPTVQLTFGAVATVTLLATIVGIFVHRMAYLKQEVDIRFGSDVVVTRTDSKREIARGHLSAITTQPFHLVTNREIVHGGLELHFPGNRFTIAPENRQIFWRDKSLNTRWTCQWVCDYDDFMKLMELAQIQPQQLLSDQEI